MVDEQLPYLELLEEDQLSELMAEDAGAVVIDVWSPDCGPCLAMADGYAAVARAFDPDEVRFCKINYADAPHLAAMLEVRSFPTILYILNGQVKDVMIGAANANKLGKRAEWLVDKARPRKGLMSRIFGGS